MARSPNLPSRLTPDVNAGCQSGQSNDATAGGIASPAARRAGSLNVLYILADWGHDLRVHQGPRTHVLGTLRGLRRLGHHPFLLTVNDCEKLPGFDDQDYHCVCHRYARFFIHRALPYTGLVDSFRVLTSALILHRRRRFHLIHERYGLYSLGGVLASRILRLPLVLEVNAPLVEEKALFTKPLGGVQRQVASLQSRLCFASAARLIVVSDTLAEYMAAVWGVPGHRMRVLPNAADVDSLAGPFNEGRIREELAIPAGTPVVGYLGTLQVWYGLDQLIEAFSRVVAVAPRALLLLVGDGQARASLDGVVSRLNLGDRVRLLGHIDHSKVPEVLSVIDVAVAPFRQTDLPFYASPLKVFEYMASGRAIVASRTGQIADVLQDRRTGLLVTPGDVASLADAILELIGDHELRAALGRAAQADAEARWSWSIYAGKLEQVYREALAGPAIP